MKTPGTRPAIGAAEDRLVAEIALDATEFASHQVECFIPRHFDERLGAAALREGAGTMLEPALAYGGTAYAQARHFVGQPVQPDRRGIGILREGMHIDGLCSVALAACCVRARPVARCGNPARRPPAPSVAAPAGGEACYLPCASSHVTLG